MFFDIFRTEAGFIGLAFSLFFVILAMRQSIWCWSMRIFSIIAYLIPLYVATEEIGGYFMGFAVGLILIDIYGWYTWASIKETEIDDPKENDAEILDVYFTKQDVVQHKTALFSNVAHLRISLGIILVWALSLYSSEYWFNNSILYILTLGFRLVAEFFLARKWIECWLVWAVADLCFLIPFCIALYPAYIIIYSIPIILALVGYISWKMPPSKES